jgi:hypothetical protein
MPYRHVGDDEPPEGDLADLEISMREELLVLATILVFSLGPLVTYLIFGTGLGFEMGIGTAISLVAALAIYRMFRPSKGPPDDDRPDTQE